MHPINVLRLRAGIQIDPSLERIVENRTVPRKRSELVQKSESTVSAHIDGITKAIAHLKNAVKALERIPAHDMNGDVPYYIQEIEEVITTDKGEAGLESLLKSYQNDLKGYTPAETEEPEEKINEDHFTKGTMITDEEGFQWNVEDYEGKGDNEKYKLVCPISGKTKTVKYSNKWHKTTKQEKEDMKKQMTKTLKEMFDFEEQEQQEPAHAANFKKGEKVIYDNGIWVVHMSDPQADMVGIIPPSMVNASEGEKAKAMQQVKREKIRKPSEEENEAMSGQSHPTMESRKVNESTFNYTKSNKVSFEDEKEDPVNVVGQADGQWANMFKLKPVEAPTQLDQRGDASMNEYTDKVVVPSQVKTAMQDVINTFVTEAKKLEGYQTSADTYELYNNTAKAFQTIQDKLNTGTIQSIKEAQLFASSLMGPMFHKIPSVVWNFLASGGQKRSLKDFMIKVD